MTRNAVYEQRLKLAHDERSRVVDIALVHITAVLGDPLCGNRSFHVRNRVDIVSAGAALIRIVSVAVQRDHHAGLSFFSSLYRIISNLECFVDIGQGSQMRSGTLQGGELYRTGLQAGLSRNLVGKGSRTAGKLLVAESIHEIGSIANPA